MLMGPPTVESVFDDSSIAAFRAARASATVGRPGSPESVSRSSGDALVAKNPELEQVCGSIRDFTQIIGVPSKKPAEIIATPFVLAKGMCSRNPDKMSFTGGARR